MTIAPYVPFAEFVAADPVLNHSSRVYDEGEKLFLDLLIGPFFELHLGSVTVTQKAGISLSVSDATIQDVAAAPATISLGSGSLTFASTAVGATTDLTLVVSNTGDADLIISGLTPTGDYSVVSFS